MAQPVPDNEVDRLNSLNSFEILDTSTEQAFDDITLLAAQICNTPIATLSIVDSDRVWYKSKHGLEQDSVMRKDSFCSHTILNDQPLVINDAIKNDTFSNISMVVNEPKIRFYAGIPLFSSDGYAIGTLAVLNTQPQELSNNQLESLSILARTISSLLIARRSLHLLEEKESEITELNEKLTKLSITDELTGLLNRGVLHDILKRELKLNTRNNHNMTLLMVDIDNLKSINEQFGHFLGDDVISMVANILKDSVRETDLCIRYDGDEFLIIVPSMDQAASEVLASHIVEEVQAQSPMQCMVTISTGITIVDGENKHDCSQVLKLTEQSLSLAKKKGTNQVETHSTKH